jgi:cell division protein FtsB
MKNILELVEQELEKRKLRAKDFYHDFCKLERENKKLQNENETLRKDLEELSVNSFLSEVATEQENLPKITIKFDENQIQIHNLKFEVAELKREIKQLKKELKRKK